MKQAGKLKLPKIPLILLSFLFILILFFSAHTVADSQIDVRLSQEQIGYNESLVVTFDYPEDSNDKLSAFFIDASELAYEREIRVDPLLNEQTLSVSRKVSPGLKELKFTQVYESGRELEGSFKIEVIDRALEEGDFYWDEAVIYFLLTDRFYNGDPSNDDPNGENYDTSHFETYHGGDLAGVTLKLDYLKDLGVNTIWITPIVDNIDFNVRSGKDSQYGYHGYWAKDFTVIDEHLGDLADFHRLIDEASDRGMKIMLDVVINHAGYGMKSGDFSEIANFPTPEEQAVFDGMLRTDPQGNHQITGELAGLPDFITEDLAVRDRIIEWQRAWIDRSTTEKGNSISYFRVDTVKHVEASSLKALNNAVVKSKSDFKMIAEFFDGDIFKNGGILDGGGMDGILDFEFKNIVRNYLRGNFEESEKQLKARNQAIDNTRTAGQFLSSHDEDGFLKVRLNGDEGLFKVAASLQLTAKGQPVIYYGEEIAQSGANAGNMDQGEFSENRYDFDWGRVDNSDMLDHYKKLLEIRKSYTHVFTRGERNSLLADKKMGISVFERAHSDRHMLVALNIKEEDRWIKVETGLAAGSELEDLYSGANYTVGDEGLLSVLVPGKNEGGTAILLFDQAILEVTLAEDVEDKPAPSAEVTTNGAKESESTAGSGEDTKEESPATRTWLLAIGLLVIVLAVFAIGYVFFFKRKS